ncbi:phage baseplate protein [Enterobacter cloacae]|uniref:phage baseplate protein n=1 Tax=Enterobacter cloacae TaxID=550 RepID=UPI003EE0BFAB
MPIESAQYIDTLQPDWPLGTDPESAGDDHLRMIKQVLQNTFPSVSGAVTPSQNEINDLGHGIHYIVNDEPRPDRWNLLLPTDSSKFGYAAAAQPSVSQCQQLSQLLMTYGNIRDMVYPVGSVVIYADNVNPATRLGFGTWVAVQGVVAGVGSITDTDGMAGQFAAGAHAGYWTVHRSQIHNESASATFTGTAASAGAHTHTYTLRDGSNPTSSSEPDNGGHNKGTGTTGSSGAHTHSVSVSGNVQIGTGTAAFTNPYYGLYVWRRTA